MKDCEAKNQILLTWIKSAFDLNDLRKNWTDFEELLNSHQLILGRQVIEFKKM